uniref:MAM domain containing 4 n=1 Tax=Pseudonaja textilis TaxID=8673 RepID=A0A670YP73_PSETE
MENGQRRSGWASQWPLGAHPLGVSFLGRLAGPPFGVQAVFVNRCGTPRVCDFVCDCWDCSDENQCGYQQASALGGPFTCSFEGTTCGWEDVSDTAYRWEPAQASIAMWGLEPPFDHTLGTDVGRGVLPLFPLPLNGSLALRCRLVHGSYKAGRTASLWQSPPGSTSSWQELVAYTGHIPGSFQVTFVSTQDFSLAQLALDDVEFRNCGFPRKAGRGGVLFFPVFIFSATCIFCKGPEGCCLSDLQATPLATQAGDDGACLGIRSFSAQVPIPPMLEPLGPCPSGQFACDQGKRCLDRELLCNFKAECDDASDEQRCGKEPRGNGIHFLPGWVLAKAPACRAGVLRIFSLQKAPGQMFSMVRAATPVLGPSGPASLLRPAGFLALAVADGSLGTRRWAWFAQSSETWRKATVPLGARKRPFQVRGGLPPAGLSCNFETDWCSWYLEQNEGFEWRQSQSRKGAVDHTTGTGSFLLAEPGGAWNPGWRTRLLSAPQAVTAAVPTVCLSFWYRLEGPQIGTLALKLKEAGEPEQVLWTRRGSQGAVWHRGSSSISPKPGQNYQVIFEALRDGFLGIIALDDLTVTPGACPAQRHCSFEAGKCGFSAPEQPAWQRQNGAGGVGPPVDHTLGEPRGHYMILHTGADKLPLGWTAVLRSGSFPPLRRTHCVSFWYHLNSRSLTAYVEEGEEGAGEAAMLSLDPTEGEAWRYGSFVQVAFAATGAGGEPSSYVALDDVLVKEGGCPEPGEASCDFESGPCGWSKPHGDWYSWDWKEAATTLRSPSPKEDHTLGTNAGHYAYVDLAVLSLGKSTARLVSEPLAPTTGSCLQFHYHMDFLGQSSCKSGKEIPLPISPNPEMWQSAAEVALLKLLWQVSAWRREATETFEKRLDCHLSEMV